MPKNFKRQHKNAQSHTAVMWAYSGLRFRDCTVTHVKIQKKYKKARPDYNRNKPNIFALLAT